jgi:tetratricopeptide (TPR) repeat protein
VKDFFISYTKVDQDWAEWIAWQLEEAGYSVIIQAWDFLAGDNFILDMQCAASEAKCTITVLSPDYLASRFAAPEWAAAFAQDPTGDKGILLPVRVRDCILTGLFPQIIYIDLVGKSASQAKEALLAGVKRTRAKPQGSPAFPSPSSPLHYTVTKGPQFPGALPPIWHVPHQRNPNFIGRSTLLNEIRSALTARRKAASTQAIVGLGGIGKTQLAVEYAYHYASNYKTIWWFRAEETATIATDYVALARALKLHERDKEDPRVVIQDVRRWLSQNINWLLVFDNADKPEDIYDYLPQGRTGHVLITSRHQDWSEVASVLQVPVLARDESINFFLLRTGQLDSKAANELAEELGDLPLALEHASAYINSVRLISLAEYLDLFRTRREELLKRAKPPLGYQATVATTWEMSFQKVQQKSLAAAELMSLSAFFASDHIPRWLIGQEPHQLTLEHFVRTTRVSWGLPENIEKKLSLATQKFLKIRRAIQRLFGRRRLPPALTRAVKDKVIFNDAAAALHRYSLIDINDKAWLIHRLVQDVALERQERDQKKRYAKMAVRLIDDAFPRQVNAKTWPVCAQLLPHSLAVARHAEMLNVVPVETSTLLNLVGVYLTETARYAEAKKVLEGALKIDERVFGPNHYRLATSLNNLGALMAEQGDLEEAQRYIERALKVGKKGFGKSVLNMPVRLNNLGAVLTESGNLVGARTCLEQALKMNEKMYGPNHISVAAIADNLGLLLQDIGDLKGARMYVERALKIYNMTYGLDHPDTAVAYNNLGRLLARQGDMAGAKMQAECALRILRKTLGDNHPKTKTTENNLKFLYGAKRWNKTEGRKTKKIIRGGRKKKR